MLLYFKAVPKVFMIRIARAEKFTTLLISQEKFTPTLILGSEENRGVLITEDFECYERG
jgi:hypothetical protein